MNTYLVLCLLSFVTVFSCPANSGTTITSGYTSHVVDDQNNHIEVCYPQGNLFTVIVNASAGGYTWDFVDRDWNHIEFVGCTKQPSTSGLIGSVGKEILAFSATSTGPDEIRLILRRPWETEITNVNRVLTVHVEVKQCKASCGSKNNLQP